MDSHQLKNSEPMRILVRRLAEWQNQPIRSVSAIGSWGLSTRSLETLRTPVAGNMAVGSRKGMGLSEGN